MPNIEDIISAKNKCVLNEDQVTARGTLPRNCRKRIEYPLNGECRNREIIYQATFKVQDLIKRKFIDLREIEF